MNITRYLICLNQSPKVQEKDMLIGFPLLNDFGVRRGTSVCESDPKAAKAYFLELQNAAKLQAVKKSIPSNLENYYLHLLMIDAPERSAIRAQDCLILESFTWGEGKCKP